MDAVVEDVSGHHQIEVGHVQDGGVVAVAVADLDDDQLVPLESEP
ncbi:hypothetical protein ACFY2Z_04415 [Streptomyces sp. NPDC001222]